MTDSQPRPDTHTEDNEVRIDSLEGAVHALTSNVSKLVDALNIVGALTAKQWEQADLQAATDRRAATAKALAEVRYKRTKRVQRGSFAALCAAIIIMPLIAYAIVTTKVDNQIKRQRADLAVTCAIRNKVNVEAPVLRERELAAHSKDINDLVAQRIHLESVDALLAGAVDCNRYLRDVK